MTKAKFEVWHGNYRTTDAWDMTDALDYCGLAANLGQTNLTIRRKSDGKTWSYN